MKLKSTAIVGTVLFLAGALLGFVPEYQKASKLSEELESARLDDRLSDIRELAALSYINASKMNYGSAAEDSKRMFGLVSELDGDTKDASLRNNLNDLSTYHDSVMGKLSAADASAQEPLLQIVQMTQRALKR
jgi:hypothetical protein